MDDLKRILDRLADAAADMICAGFDVDAERQARLRELGREHRAAATVQAVLKGELSRALQVVAGEVERKTAERFAAYLRHPRYGREPLIDEGEAADAALNTAIVAAQASGSAQALLSVELAALRVRAITKAVGPECIYPANPDATRGRSGARRRRREITAADVPHSVAGLIERAAFNGGERGPALADLAALESAPENRAGLVSKILALATAPDGEQNLLAIARQIGRARDRRGVQGAEAHGRGVSPYLLGQQAEAGLEPQMADIVQERRSGREGISHNNPDGAAVDSNFAPLSNGKRQSWADRARANGRKSRPIAQRIADQERSR